MEVTQAMGKRKANGNRKPLSEGDRIRLRVALDSIGLEWNGRRHLSCYFTFATASGIRSQQTICNALNGKSLNKRTHDQILKTLDMLEDSWEDDPPVSIAPNFDDMTPQEQMRALWRGLPISPFLMETCTNLLRERKRIKEEKASESAPKELT